MNRNLEAIAIAAARECERQQVDEEALIRLLEAHTYAIRIENRLPTFEDMLEVGRLIEPPVHEHGKSLFRRTPVTFASGGSAVSHQLINETLIRMFDRLTPDVDPEEFTKAFLDVHPFRDGNGRTAWVLYNWLRESLGDPLPLPDFYGELVSVVSEVG